MKKLGLAFLLLIFVSSCNNSLDVSQTDDVVPPPPNPADSLSQSKDSIRLVDTVTINIKDSTTTNDTTIKSPVKDNDKRYGILGYSYFKAMRQNETRNINAYVTIINSATVVIDTLRQINSEILQERKNDTASIFTQNVILYKYLDIMLIDPGSDFVIKQIHDSSRQKIESSFGNFWSWAITPKTKKKQSRLILRVVAEKPDGTHEPFQAKNIPINISLDRGILRSIYTWLFENPEKALVLILIPLVAFFWKQIVALFKRKPKNQ